ncbi:hypothetical protein [Puia dinghuensis]|uniref:hypothetical protein n=1 Tax=Puia dinghuensis TaxID=1792502 RepID=UPI0016637D7E|nr:hypothetical protein [Puia dinghuensis]
MKSAFVLLVSVACLHLHGQIIPNSGVPSEGSIIWFQTWGFFIFFSGPTPNWLQEQKAFPTSIALYETPGNPVNVVLDYTKQQFKFYVGQTTTGPPDHTNTVLHFIGNDGEPYSITFLAFVGQ